MIGLFLWVEQIKKGYTNYLIFNEWHIYSSICFVSISCASVILLIISVCNLCELNCFTNRKKMIVVSLSLFSPVFYYSFVSLVFPFHLMDKVKIVDFVTFESFDFWIVFACIIICSCFLFFRNSDKFISSLGVLFSLILIVEKIIPHYSQVFVVGFLQPTMLAIPNIINISVITFFLMIAIGGRSSSGENGLKAIIAFYLIASFAGMIADYCDCSFLGLMWGYFVSSDSFVGVIILGAIVPLSMLTLSRKRSSKILSIVTTLILISVFAVRYRLADNIENSLFYMFPVGFGGTGSIEEVFVIVGFLSVGTVTYKIMSCAVSQNAYSSLSHSSNC